MANGSSPAAALNVTSSQPHRAQILENPLRTYLLGIIISICGNVLISISLNIQKYAHVRQSQRGSKPYYTSGVWWCGVALMGLGELGNFAAYGFAPASLVAPLGCVSVIASAVLSVVFLKETVRASDIVGGTLAITGTYVLVNFAPHTTIHITALLVQYYVMNWHFLLYLVIQQLQVVQPQRQVILCALLSPRRVVRRLTTTRLKAVKLLDRGKSSAKVKRKYHSDYIKFGFFWTGDEEDPNPHCVLCYESLANEAMKPAKLKRHFESKHKDYIGKPLALFERKRDELKKHMTKAPSHFFATGENAKATEASYRVSLLIAKNRETSFDR
ncbi:NIPA-like protein 2 isoform X3 [Eleginops maclovinus]|uniref:NIPA-like protein 2 isoform X3 n=1 Tax=Eleginops maclovinus TaxID=56733 RepID=UPI0030806C0A